MILQPSNDNIIIKLEKTIESEKKTESGIILQTKTDVFERPNKGQVYAVGKGRITSSGERVVPDVEKGDFVIFNKFAGTEVDLEDERYLIIKENDILAKIK